MKPDLLVLQAALNTRHKTNLRGNERLVLTHEQDGQAETLILDVVADPEVFRFEARVYLEDVPAAEESTTILLDFLDGVLEEWLAGDREAYPTLDFSPYQFRNVTLGLRGGAQRPDLEALADALLAGANPHRNGDPHE